MSSLCETVGKKFTVRARERDALAIIYMVFSRVFVVNIFSNSI